MKVIKALLPDKYKSDDRYSCVEEFIYKDATGGVGSQMSSLESNPVYCITLYCELEEGEEQDMQYPLEDILDKYLVNCTDVFDVKKIDNKYIFIFEVEGEDLGSIKEIFSLIGKRIFNYDDGGQMKLGIE